ncbi:MAG: hypothetical protein JST74_11415 [Bacteroidetes bacterium]|nr:hypothetical protein [Bacteroidota bacterium]
MKLKLVITLFTVFFGTTLIAQNLDSIKTELERDYNASLSLRQKVMPTINKYGYKSKQMDSLNSLILNFDSLALGRTINIIEKYGWLGKSKIGHIGNQTLFLNIQHANDKNVREKYYPMLEKSAKTGESNLSDMATMKDRILVENGQQQIYGTQRDIEGKYFPINDIKGLNKRRRQVGLEKLKVNDGDLRQAQI